MFVESIRRGEATELLACSNNKEVLREKMRDDIRDFIEGVYGADWGDDEYLTYLTKPESVEDFWSDEDDEYETVFSIVEVKEIF